MYLISCFECGDVSFLPPISDPNCGVSKRQKFKNFMNSQDTPYAMPNDFITTIDSDDEIDIQAESSKSRQNVEKDDFDPDFEFDFGGNRDNGLNSWEIEQANEVQKVPKSCLCVLTVDYRC